LLSSARSVLIGVMHHATPPPPLRKDAAMFPSPPARPRRRGVTAFGALTVTGALLLSPALTAASPAPATAAVSASESQLTLPAMAFTAGDTITVDYATDQAH